MPHIGLSGPKTSAPFTTEPVVVRRTGSNLQRILYHRHILYHVLIHIQNEFKLYPYIWLSKGDLGDFLNLAHFSSQTVLLGRNERNSHKHSCLNLFSQASGTCKLQQLCLWEFLSFRPGNTAAMAQKFECGEAFTNLNDHQNRLGYRDTFKSFCIHVCQVKGNLTVSLK